MHADPVSYIKHPLGLALFLHAPMQGVFDCIILIVVQYFVAALYNTTLEKSVVEFAAAYIGQNQQFAVDPSYWLATFNMSTIASNKTARENIGNLVTLT